MEQGYGRDLFHWRALAGEPRGIVLSRQVSNERRDPRSRAKPG
jgi:hypothetical protein